MFLGAFLAVTVCAKVSRAAEVTLLTVGPGADTTSLYGHSLICVRDDGPEETECYDFGVPVTPSYAFRTLRGQAAFGGAKVPLALARQTFEQQGRSVWVQRLPIQDVSQLTTALEAELRKPPYAYHPYFENCATKLRDLLDVVTGGALGRVSKGATSAPFRHHAERGFSGKPLELFLLSLVLTPSNERIPSAWELMFLPEALRDRVADALAAPAIPLSQRAVPLFETSPHAGRALSFALAGVLVLLLRGAARVGSRAFRRVATAALTVLGLLALVPWSALALLRIPELSGSLSLLCLVPVDPLVFARGTTWTRAYLTARIGITATLALLGLAFPFAAPSASVAWCSALVLFAVWLGPKKRG